MLKNFVITGGGSIGKRHLKNLISLKINKENIFVLEPRQDRMNDPTAKLANKQIILSFAIFNIILAIGIDNKKGTCTNKKWEKVFKIAIKPKLNPFKCIINKFPFSKSS